MRSFAVVLFLVSCPKSYYLILSMVQWYNIMVRIPDYDSQT